MRKFTLIKHISEEEARNILIKEYPEENIDEILDYIDSNGYSDDYTVGVALSGEGANAIFDEYYDIDDHVYSIHSFHNEDK